MKKEKVKICCSFMKKVVGELKDKQPYFELKRGLIYFKGTGSLKMWLRFCPYCGKFIGKKDKKDTNDLDDNSTTYQGDKEITIIN